MGTRAPQPAGPTKADIHPREFSLAFLTNILPHYRLSTVSALATRLRALVVILTRDVVPPEFRESSVPIVKLGGLRLPMQRRHPSGYVQHYELHLPWGILGALRRARPDAIFAAELGPRTTAAALYRTFFDRHCVLVIHADLSEHTELGRSRLRLALRRWLARRADLVAVNGASGARYVATLGTPASQIVMFPYPTDCERFADLPEGGQRSGPLRLLYVGRLVQLKGLEPFVSALARVLAGRPSAEVEFVIAGDGDQRERLASMALPSNLQLRFAGPIAYDALPAVYRDAEVFVMPSLGDTWGLVVNEAMASGLPVLGSQHAQAVQELVGTDLACGWTFEPGDPSSLEAAISRMLDTDRAVLRNMGERAHARALELEPGRIVDELLERIDAVRRQRETRPHP